MCAIMVVVLVGTEYIHRYVYMTCNSSLRSHINIKYISCVNAEAKSKLFLGNIHLLPFCLIMYGRRLNISSYYYCGRVRVCTFKLKSNRCCNTTLFHSPASSCVIIFSSNLFVTHYLYPVH